MKILPRAVQKEEILMYLYETHLHTSPVSNCGRASVRESLEFYKSIGYRGVFITDHFIDSNLNVEARDLPYEEKIKYYFSAYEEGVAIGKEIGLDVFLGIEMGEGWAHILVYGIDKEWCLAHPEIEGMKKIELLPILSEAGALLIQAHPFRNVKSEIRLFPRHVHGTEIYNAARGEFENKLAQQFCENYELIPFAGSDNHRAGGQEVLGGMATERPIKDVDDFKALVLSREAKPFIKDESGVRLL